LAARSAPPSLPVLSTSQSASFIDGRNVRLAKQRTDPGSPLRFPQKKKKRKKKKNKEDVRLPDAILPPWAATDIDDRLLNSEYDQNETLLQRRFVRTAQAPPRRRQSWEHINTTDHRPKTVGHFGASGNSRVKNELAKFGNFPVDLRAQYMLSVTFAEMPKIKQFEHTAVHAETSFGTTQKITEATEQGELSDTESEAEDYTTLPKKWPNPAREMREHLHKLQVLVEKSLQRKLFNVWPDIELGFAKGDSNLAMSSDLPNAILTLSEFCELLRGEDVALVEEDVKRVLNRTYFHSEGVMGDVSFQQFYDEWFPDEADRMAWEPAALKLRRERAAEKALKAKQRGEFEASVARRKRAAANMMRTALNEVLKTGGLASYDDRCQARILLFKLLHGRELKKAPKKVNLKDARAKIIATHCSQQGLDGLTVYQAVQIVHNCSAEVIQCYARGYYIRARMFKVQAMYERIQGRLIRAVFLEWLRIAEWRIALRVHCLPKIKRWHNYKVGQDKRRLYFRVCFWPFFVWHREAHKSMIGRAKAKFLVRVVRAHNLLRHFRALRHIVDEKKARKLKIDGHRQNRIDKAAKRACATWHAWAKGRGEKLRLWRTKGVQMRKFHINKFIMRYFAVWRYYASSRRLCVKRSFRYFHQKLARKRVPSFPRITDLPWAKNLPTELGAMCEPTWLKLSQKDRYMLRVNAMRYKRLAPQILAGWVAARDYKKKKRYAIWRGANLVQRKAFTAFVLAVQESKEENRDITDPARQAEEEAKEKIRVQERQRVQRVKDKEACERYKEQWSIDQTWRVMSMARQKEAMKKLAEQQAHHRHQASKRAQRETLMKERQAVRSEGIHTFLAEQKKKTERGCDIALRCSKRLLRNRGRVLHDAMVKAVDQAEQMHMRQVLKGVLRALRLPMMTKRSLTLLRRAKLRNWCRICGRYQYIWRAMPLYRKLRTQWMIWNKWLQFLDQRIAFETPGLVEDVRRRRVLVRGFSEMVQERNVTTCSTEDELRGAQITLKAIYLRWVEITQRAMCYKKMVAASCARAQSRLLQTVFYSWRSNLKRGDTLRARKAEPSFLEKRATADLDKLRVRLLKHIHGLQTHQIRRIWHFRQNITIKRAIAEPTMKRMLAHQKVRAAERLALERQLLLYAFDQRGQSEFDDLIDGPMGGSGGEIFSDDGMPQHTRIDQIVIHCSDGIDGISLITKSGANTTRTPFRGSNSGERHQFELREGEALVRIEGVAGRSVNRLRFHTTLGRASRWFGKNEMGERFMLGGAAEAGDTIVGLCGRSSPGALDAIGVVIRHTTEVNIFSDCWLPGEIELGNDGAITDQGSLAEEQFAHILRMRACDVEVALERSQRLAKQLWRTANNTPAGVGTLNNIRLISSWLFEALTRGLVCLEETPGGGAKMKAEGEILEHHGVLAKEKGDLILLGIDGYDTGGNHNLNVAQLGTTMLQTTMELIEEGEELQDKGTADVKKAKAMQEKGKELMPEIPTSPHVIKYFMALYKLAQTSTTLQDVGLN
jgi:hypothetical protein